jgi:hypothetical protein
LNRNSRDQVHSGLDCLEAADLSKSACNTALLLESVKFAVFRLYVHFLLVSSLFAISCG